jgi:DNA-binding transcriptional MocR family regulator
MTLSNRTNIVAHLDRTEFYLFEDDLAGLLKKQLEADWSTKQKKRYERKRLN